MSSSTRVVPAHGGERALGRGRRGAKPVDQPGRSAEERKNREAERQDGDLLERQLQRVEIERETVRRRRIRTEQPGQIARERHGDRLNGHRQVDGEERLPRPPERLGRRPPGPARLQEGIDGDGESEGRDEQQELRAGEHRDADRGQRERVGERGSAHHGVCQREQRPAEGGVRDDFRQQEEGEHDPGHRHGERAGPEAPERADARRGARAGRPGSPPSPSRTRSAGARPRGSRSRCRRRRRATAGWDTAG